MLKNYLKIAFRNLLKHKAYSFINIAGLALGMACGIMILQWVRFELSYDAFHPNAERIYRVVQEQRFSGNAQQVAVTSAPVAPALTSEFPEVESAVRIRPRTAMVAYGEKSFWGERVVYADSNVFSFFHFPLLAGDAATALAAPNALVLSERMAQKYFGDEDPLGKTLRFNNRSDYLVTGVMKNVPENSHLRAEAVASFAVLKNEPWFPQWGGNTIWTFVRLREGATAAALSQKLPEFIKKYRGAGDVEHITYYLQPLRDIHLRSHMIAEMGPNGDLAHIYIFSAVALFILALATINYMNLATARSTQRMKEIGIRKVLGGQRAQLVKQFLGESLLIAVLALIFAVVLAEMLLPRFSMLVGKKLALQYQTDFFTLVALLGLSLVVGLVAGSFPAFYLAAFQPAAVLKGTLKSGLRAARLRKALVIAQFAVSITLLLGTAAVFRQLRHIKAQHLGFNQEHVVNLMIRSRSGTGNIWRLKSELLKNPRVVSATATSNFMGEFFGQTTFYPEGAEHEGWQLSELYIDPDFMQTMEVPIIAGRGFSATIASDSLEGFMINEAAVQEMGWLTPEEALGKRLVRGDERRGPIIGVIKDFNFTSLHQAVAPLVLIYNRQELLPLSVRIRPEEISNTLAALEQTWKSFAPAWPFTYSFLDADLDKLYRADQKAGQIFAIFATVAIVIACLGLFGLASYTAERRTKEIGVRKVLGASVTHVIALLSKEFVRLVLLANLIAWPIGYFAMQQWLQNFAYRIELDWWLFALAGGIALLIALLTVSTQAIRAALANPVEALRYE